MVIQRLQSLFLLLSSIVMGITSFMPFASEGDKIFAPKDSVVFLVVNILIATLLFLSIFMYKNLKRQKTVVLVSLVLTVVSAITGCCTAYSVMQQPKLDWTGGALMLLCTLMLTVAAYRRIVADERLLKSYDRLR